MYISVNSLFYLAIPVLAGSESMIAVVGVAVVITLVPQVFLDTRSTSTCSAASG